MFFCFIDWLIRFRAGVVYLPLFGKKIDNMNKLKIIKQQHKIKDKMIVLKDSAIDNKDELMAMLAQNVINDCDKIIEFCVKRIQLEMLEKKTNQ